MSKKISIDEVNKLAVLSQIQLTDNEAASLVAELDKILDYVSQLNEVDTTEVEPTSQVTGLVNVSRSDSEIDYKVSSSELLENTPEVENQQIKTKRVL